MSGFFVKILTSLFLIDFFMVKTIYVISVDDERYISETIKEEFGCGGKITGIELRPTLTHSILESKHFHSEEEAFAFLETDKFKNAWRWNPDLLIPKHYFIKKVELELTETIIKTITVKD